MTAGAYTGCSRPAALIAQSTAGMAAVQNGDEDEERRQQPVRPVRDGREVWQRTREIPDRKRPCKQRANHEPAHVNVDWNSSNREHTHRPTHVVTHLPKLASGRKAKASHLLRALRVQRSAEPARGRSSEKAGRRNSVVAHDVAVK